MITNSPSVIDTVRCEVGENPLWHIRHQCLYWTDIPAGQIYRYSPQSGVSDRIYQGKVVGGFTIQSDDSLLLFMVDGSIATLLKDGELEHIIDVIPDEQGTRFNDVIADPKGRVFCGTMATKDRGGRLYRLDIDGKLTKLLDDVQCSNGLAFSPDLTYLYYTDSYAYVIYRFRYSQDSGEIGDPEVFIRGQTADGFPDGLVRDAEGCLWSARWGGGCIIRYTPDGNEDRRITLPAKNVTSLAFGGPDLDDIYVTTAKGPGELGGATLLLKIGINGVPEFASRVRMGV